MSEVVSDLPGADPHDIITKSGCDALTLRSTENIRHVGEELALFSIVVDATTDSISQGQNITHSDSIVSAKDPSLGTVELKMDPKQPNEYFIISGSQILWRSGVWNGEIFTMVLEMRLNYIYNIGLYSDENETYFTYSVKYSTISRLLLNISEQVKQLNLLDGAVVVCILGSTKR
ncbi:hypothetical protein QYF36_009974 [Acer negundo]|nr:hypothetical protein QYF36_009974 [Acer negundo]